MTQTMTVEERLAVLETEVAELSRLLKHFQPAGVPSEENWIEKTSGSLAAFRDDPLYKKCMQQAREELNGPAETGEDLARKLAVHYEGIPREVLEEADRLGREVLGRGVAEEG